MAAAEAFVFFLGGYETTSGALQFSTYEIDKNQSVQDKIRAEIKQEMDKSNGKITYEGLFGLKYLGYAMDGLLISFLFATIFCHKYEDRLITSCADYR